MWSGSGGSSQRLTRQGAPRVYLSFLVPTTQAANDIVLVWQREMSQVGHIELRLSRGKRSIPHEQATGRRPGHPIKSGMRTVHRSPTSVQLKRLARGILRPAAPTRIGGCYCSGARLATAQAWPAGLAGQQRRAMPSKMHGSGPRTASQHTRC